MKQALIGLIGTVVTMQAFAVGTCGSAVLGTFRTLTLPRAAAAYGTVQHGALPLQPNEVVLTFDDGPRSESTPKVLKALRDECVQATFFMVGEALRDLPKLAQQVQSEGHSVAMHSFRHPHLGALSEAEQLADLHAMELSYREVFKAPAPAYRFPFLEETPTLIAALKEQQITVMSVDVGIDDWLPDQTPKILADRLTERLAQRRGGIVLLHDAQDQTAEALPLLLRTLKAEGYRIVHLRWDADRR
jgi:peptidoglycan/xylan/chitin deacetylase (PgdA/CDA1 family)